MTSRLVSPIPAEGHPFRITQIFFLSIRVTRSPTIPGPVQGLPLTVEIAYSPPEPGQSHGVLLRLRSDKAETQPLRIQVVASGLFDYLGEGQPTDDELNHFLNDFLLAAMTARVIQVIGSLTAEMGMPPVWVDMPRGFGVDITSLRSSAEKKEGNSAEQAKPEATENAA